MDIIQLFMAAWMPVLKMLLLMAVGSFIATDLVGILVEEARKHLNNVVFYVFTPAFVTNNLSQTFTLERLISSWFLPINILLTFAFGSAFGWILVKVTRAPSHLRAIILGCCASGNLGIMLFIVIPNTCSQKGSPFGDPNTCSKQAFAYSSISRGIYDLIFWSYVYNIVRLSINVGGMNLSIVQDVYAPDPEKGFELSIPVSVWKNHEEANKMPMVPTTKRKALILWKKMETFSQRPVMVAINRLFTPSIVGAILGLLTGVVSPLRKTLIGENAPLQVIQGVIKMLGDGTIPSSSIVIGGNLLKGLRKSEMKTSFVVGVVIVRYLLLPLTGVGIIIGATHLGLLHSDQTLYKFILLVQYALPPAMNMGVLSQLFGVGENEVSVIFLWLYGLTLILFPLWSAFFMWMVTQ